MLVNAAGVSPSQAPIEAILKVDLYGTAVLLEEIGKAIKSGGVGVTISSQSGQQNAALSPEADEQLATTPTEELLELDILRPENIKDTLHAYQMAKRCNEKRVMAESVKWGEKGARINSISPRYNRDPTRYRRVQRAERRFFTRICSPNVLPDVRERPTRSRTSPNCS